MRRWKSWTLRIILLLAILLLVALLLLQTSYVQNKLSDILLSQLSEKYNAQWEIGNIHVNFFDEISAENIIFLDQQNDTLLASEKLHIDISVCSLFGKQITIDEISFQGLKSHIYSLENETYNYDFLLSDENMTEQEDDDISKTKSWQFSIKKLNISDLDFIYKNATTDFSIEEKEIAIFFDKIDLDNDIVSATSLSLRNGKSKIISSDDSENTELASSFFPDLGLGLYVNQLNIEDQIIDYRDNASTYKNIHLELLAENVKTNDTQLEAEINALKFHHPDILENAHIVGSLHIAERIVELDKLDFTSKNNTLTTEKFIYNAEAKTALEAKKLNLHLSGAFLDRFRNYIPAQIDLISGIPLTLNADKLKYTDQKFVTSQFRLNYGKAIQSEIELQIDELNNIGKLNIRSSIDRLTIDIPTLRKLIPAIEIPERFATYDRVDVAGEVYGNLSQLFLKNTNIEIENQLKTKLSGSVLNIGNENKLSYDLQLDYIDTDIQFLQLDSIELVDIPSLGKINYAGILKGDLEKITIDGLLISDIGQAKTDIDIVFPTEEAQLSYEGDIHLIELDMTTFLKRNDIGKATLRASIDGKGLDLDNLEAILSASVDHIQYKDYDYNNIRINATIIDRKITSDLDIKDENINLAYNGIIDIKSDKYTLDIEGEIDTLAPKSLGFLEDDYRFSGRISAKIDLPLQEGETASLDLDELYVSLDNKQFREDSVRVLLHKRIDTTYLTTHSSYIDIIAQGIYEPEKIWSGIQQTINHYYTISDTIEVDAIDGFVQGSAILKNSEIINFFLKDRYVYTKGANINFKTDFPSHFIDASIIVDSLVIDKHHTDSLYITVAESDERLVLQSRAIATYLENKFLLPDLLFTNEIAKNKVLSTLSVGNDAVSDAELYLSTLLSKQDHSTQLILQDSLFFNNTDWQVDPQNSVTLTGGKVLVDQLNITDTKQSISISSEDTVGNDYKLNFVDFDVNSIVQILYSDTVQLSGFIDGYVDIKDLRENMFYLIQLDVNDIVYQDIPVGNLEIRATESQLDGTINSNISLTGKNNLTGQGIYDPSVEHLDLTLDIVTLEARLLDLFLYGTIANTEGIISGKIRANGHKDMLTVDGDIATNSLKSTIIANNTAYDFGNQQLSFDENIIDIGELVIEDKEKNKAKIVGLIYHDFFADFVLDLSVYTDKFLFLNSTSQENPILYGDIFLGADINLSGPLDLIQVDALAETRDNTTITLSPFSETESILKEEFLSYGKPEDFEKVNTTKLVKSARKYPFDVNLLLEATDLAAMRIIVDPISGDKLDVKGSGNLRANLKPDGSQEIFGLYKISSGTYSFSYGDFVTRNFIISPGSTVKFVGDPLNAELDITAIYEVYTSTYELIKNEPTLDDNEINSSKNRTNIEVSLTLKGKIQAPEISLDINTSNSNSGKVLVAVERKLDDLRNNTNELNNQVFGLLIFNNFILSNNNSTALSGVGTGIALNSISGLISSQLNKLANNTIKGVDINFDVASYNSKYTNEGAGGNITELGLSVSKQLFNERLIVKAGGNINLEENGNTSQYSSIIGDFVLEYKLTEKGNYRVRVFSKSNYDRLLNENSNKNGVSLYFSKSFDSKTAHRKND